MKNKPNNHEFISIRQKRAQIRQMLVVFDGMSITKTIKKNEIIYLEGDQANNFYYLKKGKVKTYAILNNDTEKVLLIYE